MLRNTILLIFFSLLAIEFYAQNVYLDSTVTLINTTNATVGAGDTIFLESGKYEYLFIKNIHGNPDTPVVITNHGGEVIIENNHYFGISFQNCQHIKLSGAYKYGIRILKVGNGAGIGISALSNFFEVSNIEIANTSLAGIMCKTEPGCDFASSRDSFLMENIHIHNNYLHDIGKEGMYIGSTKYFGKLINCNGKDTLVFPHLLKNVEVHNNRIERTGWDGLQLSSATLGGRIYNNKILYDSQAEQDFQMSGIIVGSGSDCDCFNNYIAFGKGIGIEFYGTGGQRIFNNIIIEAGRNYAPNDPYKEKHGIYIGHKTLLPPDSSFRVFNNTIIRPKSDGIRFSTGSDVSSGNRVENNIIIDPGAWKFYDSINSHHPPEDAYVFEVDTALDVTISNNIFSRDMNIPRFLDTTALDFTLQAGSPAIDSGKDLSADSILFDFYYHARPKYAAWDIGAFEFDSATVAIQQPMQSSGCRIIPNPATQWITIEAEYDIFDVQLFSIHGEKVLDQQQIPSGYSLNINNLKPGFYLLFILKNGSAKAQAHKIIVF